MRAATSLTETCYNPIACRISVLQEDLFCLFENASEELERCLFQRDFICIELNFPEEFVELDIVVVYVAS